MKGRGERGGGRGMIKRENGEERRVTRRKGEEREG